MEQSKIGIVTDRKILEANRPFKDSFNFINNFSKRIASSNAIPLGVLFPDGIFKEEYLDIYDGFLLTSGSKCYPYHLATIHYAITHNKPLLGICLGQQALGIYSYVIDKLEGQNIKPTYDKIIKFYETIMEDEEIFLKKIKGHNPEPTFYYSSISKSKHKILINENSLLKDIYMTNVIEEPSLHNFVVKESGKQFKVSATGEDGYIEALEYNNPNYFILGVQFHAELESTNDILFNRFIEETKKRKWHFLIWEK